MLLVEEFQQHGVEVIFLKGSVAETPEGKLLLHMQGAIAEYERTRIAERTRRGKLYWARQGALVGHFAPYGYQFVHRSEGARAHLKLEEYQVAVVRRMYCWLLQQHLSTRAIARRLTEQGTATAKGAAQWQPTAVDRILRNPVYKGTFFYQRAESVLPSRRISTDPYRHSRKTGRKMRPSEEWIAIPVPPILDEATWQQAQEQLRQNSEHSPRNNKRHQYLLRGLIRCPRCGSTYTGATQHGYRLYRCTRTDASLSSTGKKCRPGSIAAGPVERVVREAIKETLQRPEVLADEYRRRLAQCATASALEAERKQVVMALKRLKAQGDRVTDAYIGEAMDLERYKVEMNKVRQRRKELERVGQDIDRRARQEQDSRKALERIEHFCRRVSEGLDALTFEEGQQLLQLLVERITVENGRVRIEAAIPMGDTPGQLRTHHAELVEAWRRLSG